MNPSVPPPLIEGRALTVRVGRKTLLDHIDIAVRRDEIVTLIGPNGAGKTTLIRTILGIMPAAAGTVTRQSGLRVGYVPQRESVDWDFPVTAADVVLMGTYGRLGWLRRPGRAEREIARRCLEQVGMEAFASRQIRQLSGGQQQRVFLARALAQDARIYFMDEPFAGVDAATEAAIVELLQTLRSADKTVFVVHHDLQTVREYFDHVILLNMRLVASGPTATTFTNENLHTTYGGRLTILDEAAEAVRQREPSR